MHNPVYTFKDEAMQMDPQTQPSHNSFFYVLTKMMQTNQENY